MTTIVDDSDGSYLIMSITGSLVIFPFFPFFPFMISDFFPDLDCTEIGKKAGFLGSSYYIGSFAGSLMVSIIIMLGSCDPL